MLNFDTFCAVWIAVVEAAEGLRVGYWSHGARNRVATSSGGQILPAWLSWTPANPITSIWPL
jgi:hypothetical protein